MDTSSEPDLYGAGPDDKVGWSTFSKNQDGIEYVMGNKATVCFH